MSSIRKTLIKMANSLVLPERANKNRPFTVIVEGNIGSGKTTFLEYFNSRKNISVLSEPVDMWRNCNGHNLFGLMYGDAKRWGFTFQSYVQLTMLRQHTKMYATPIKLMERSIFSARYCFVEKMYRDGILSSPSVSVLDAWFKWAIETQPIDVDLIVYLRTSPEVVYDRMLQRNRTEEKAVPLDYLKGLHDIHEDWLYHKTLHNCPAPVIVLNADKDKTVIQEEYEKCETLILPNVAVNG